MRKSEFDSRKLPPKPDYLINQPKTGLTSYQLRKLIIVEAARRAGCESDSEIADFCRRNPDLCNPIADLPGLELAFETVLDAVRQKKKIVIYGDFDCDGISSVVLMLDFLEAIPQAEPERISWFIPDRFDDGYGVTEAGLRGCIAKEDPDLLIVVDCGSSQRKELDGLRKGEFGREVGAIVIDHHGVSETSEPHPAIAHLNPHAHPVKTPAGRGLRDMCAAGLAFLFCDAMSKAKNISAWDYERALIFAGMATYADVVPLRRINRTLVKKSIWLCNHEQFKRVLGLRALHKRLHRRARQRVWVDEHTFGFEWGPCLNANGRLDHARTSVELLRSQKAREALRKAYECVTMNTRRIAIQQSILDEADIQARAQVEDRNPVKIILAAAPVWEVGVVGIVASRLKERYYRPVIVCGMDNENNWRGSGRSVEGYDMGKWFREAKDYKRIQSGGGHPMAGGLRFTEKQRLVFHDWLDERCSLSQEDFVPRCEGLADAKELPVEDWWQLITGLAPFGQKNVWRPIFLREARLESFLVHGFSETNQWPEEEKPSAEKTNPEKMAESADENDNKADEEAAPPPALITGHFLADEKTKPVKVSVTWREVDRARREWRVGKKYILELDVRRKGRKDDVSYYFAVLNSWEMPEEPEAAH